MQKARVKYGLAIVFIILSVALAISSYAAINMPDYKISHDSITQLVKFDEFDKISVSFLNKRSNPMNLFFSLSGNVTEHVRIDSENIYLGPNEEKTLELSFLGEELGIFDGTLEVSGGIRSRIPIRLIIYDPSNFPVEYLSMSVEPLKRSFYFEEPLRFKIDLQNLLSNEVYNISLQYYIEKKTKRSDEKSNITFTKKESIIIDKPVTRLIEFEPPRNFNKGDYVLNITANYLTLNAQTSAQFTIKEKLMEYPILGIVKVKSVLWAIMIIIPLVGLVFYVRYLLKKRKRYKSDINANLLPKPGQRSVRIGKIAETNKFAYFDLDQLTMHTLIAGSTGGGKTVSAEVLAEEALLKDTTLIVFDPTAQWSGFLRRCQNKKMIDLYADFGLKKTDAKAFNGNVHQILNARQVIDIKKYMIPGEIHVFAINRLDPKDIDKLVANTIRQVFKANLPEAPQLRMIIVFDEVHRLLPKFGGSGEGFLQIERGAREFRKWGVGLMLISQVLTDFIGETKANINTELQMRTRDQGDLDRIKNKYGAMMLQSLLKAATGTGMVQNSAYNRGNPYFVTFRPLLHEHARLSDEELEKYNKYNDMVDDLEYEIKQLEEFKVDVFDLKLELKMTLDKVKAGSFNMVDIYLQGLKPRVKEQWDKIGKIPKKREIQLVDEEELLKEFENAKKERRVGASMQAAADNKQSMPTLTLDNGVSVKGVTELIDSINTMEDDEALKYKEKFSAWVKEKSPHVADEVMKAKTKEDLIIALEQAQ